MLMNATDNGGKVLILQYIYIMSRHCSYLLLLFPGFYVYYFSSTMGVAKSVAQIGLLVIARNLKMNENRFFYTLNSSNHRGFPQQ